jgi:hypothetical protein
MFLARQSGGLCQTGGLGNVMVLRKNLPLAQQSALSVDCKSKANWQNCRLCHLPEGADEWR